MTEQIRETVKLNNREYETYSFPEIPALFQKEAKAKEWGYSSCVRNYAGEWEVRDNKLLLVNINLPSFKEEMFAKWFSGDVVIPGNVNNQSEELYHASDLVSVKQPLEESWLRFKNGVLQEILIKKADISEYIKIMNSRRSFWSRIFS